MEKLKELVKNKFILILVAIASFFIVKELKTQYSLNKAYEKGSENVIKKYDEIANKVEDGKSVVEEVRKEFTNIATDDLNKKSGNEKIFGAANYVWGAYALNARGRYDFCKQYGVDISKFTNAYKAKNKSIFDAVIKIQTSDFKSHGMTYNENDLYNSIKEAQAKMVKQDMLEVSQTWKTNDMAIVCQNFNTSADAIVDIVALNKTMPQFVQIVMDGVGNFK